MRTVCGPTLASKFTTLCSVPLLCPCRLQHPKLRIFCRLLGLEEPLPQHALEFYSTLLNKCVDVGMYACFVRGMAHSLTHGVAHMHDKTDVS